MRAISGLLLLTYFGLLCNFWHIFEPLVDGESIKTFDTRSDPGSERAFNVSMERAPTRGWKKCRTLHYRSFVWHFFFDTFWMQRILKSVAWKCHENQFTLPFSTYRNLTIASTLPPSARPPLSLPRRDPALTIARMRLRNLMKSILKSVAEKGHENEFALQFLGYQNLIIASKKRHPLCRIWNFSFLSEKRRFVRPMVKPQFPNPQTKLYFQ